LLFLSCWLKFQFWSSLSSWDWLPAEHRTIEITSRLWLGYGKAGILIVTELVNNKIRK
jgi:hypothetical protein